MHETGTRNLFQGNRMEYPVQYGPSLARIAASYWPGITLKEGPVHHRLCLGKISPESEEKVFALVNRARAVNRTVNPGDLVEGDVTWLNSYSPNDGEGVSFSSVGFVLEKKVARSIQNCWTAWLVSGYTAYATPWDVLIPLDEEPDIEACVVHARCPVELCLDSPVKCTVRASEATLHQARAVHEEFLSLALSGNSPSFTYDEKGARLISGSNPVMTGKPIASEDDLRLELCKMHLLLATELNDLTAKAVR